MFLWGGLACNGQMAKQVPQQWLALLAPHEGEGKCGNQGVCPELSWLQDSFLCWIQEVSCRNPYADLVTRLLPHTSCSIKTGAVATRLRRHAVSPCVTRGAWFCFH